MDLTSRFVHQAPADQNVLDLFEGEWSSAMPSWSRLTSVPGHAKLFADSRLLWFQDLLGPIKGANVLELGPLEGAHSFMLDQLGAASVTAIEANTRAFLKCLCIKELFGLHRVHFKLGNFIPFLEECGSFDVLLASGVLYHMVDPLKLLELITKRSDRVFLWTHYFDADLIAKRADRELFAPSDAISNTTYRGSKRLYPEAALSWAGFSGGAENYAIWLERKSVLQFFLDRGFEVTTAHEQEDHENGPALSLCAVRR